MNKKYFIGVDTAQHNTGFSVVDESGLAKLSVNLANESPEECYGTEMPDFIKNSAQREAFVHRIKDLEKSGKIEMILFEGPSYGYGGPQMISIGSIHGIFWDFCMLNDLSFAILTPKSINYAVFGTAKDITKSKTIMEMKKRHPEIKIRDSNMADSLAMADLARKFFFVLKGKDELDSFEREVLLSKAKYKDEPKGLIYQENYKFHLSKNFSKNSILLED